MILQKIQEPQQGSVEADEKTETFQETQRRRFIRTNQLVIIIASIACLSEFYLATPNEALMHILVAIPVFTWFLVCNVLAKRSQNVERLAQVWMAIGCFSLWSDIAISGGLTGHAASMLYLLPIGSALVLGFRDILYRFGFNSSGNIWPGLV